MKFFGPRLVEARKVKGLTQLQLASQVGVVRQLVNKWEHGDNAPSGDNLTKLAEVLGKPTDYFFEVPTQNGPQPGQPILTRLAPMPPSKAKLVREAQAKLREALGRVAKAQEDKGDQDKVALTLARLQQDILAAMDKLEELRD